MSHPEAGIGNDTHAVTLPLLASFRYAFVLTIVFGFSSKPGPAVVTTKTNIDPPLNRLGEVTVFEDPLPKGWNEAPNSRFYYITNDGKRIFQGRPGEDQYLHTWKRGEREVLTVVYYGVNYGLTSKQAGASWMWIRNGGLHLGTGLGARKSPSRIQENFSNVSHFVQIVGPLDDGRMAFWSSEMGDYGVVASSFFWIDIAKRGPASAGLPLFERRKLVFVALDAPRKILLVRTLESADSEGNVTDPGEILAYSLTDDFRQSRRIPLPNRYKNFRGEPHSPDFRWRIDRSKTPREIDARTSKSLTLPAMPGINMHFQYVGSDLFISTSDESKRPDHTLFLWDRTQQKAVRIGRWLIVGKSPKGNYMIVRKFEPVNRAAPLYFIRRR